MGLPDLCTGKIVEDFHLAGKEWVDQERLKINKRKDLASEGRF